MVILKELGAIHVWRGDFNIFKNHKQAFFFLSFVFILFNVLFIVCYYRMGFVLHSEVCCSKAHSHQKFGHGHSHGGHGHSHGGHGHSHGGHGHSHGGHGHSHNGSDHLHDRQTQGHNSHRQSYEDHIHKDLLDVPSQVDHSPSVGDFDYHQFHSDSDFESSGHQLTNVNSEGITLAVTPS